MTALDHDGLLIQKEAHPDWIWNRSDTHVILGVPRSPESFKTVVEPGNSFSPGFRSYAVSTWVSTGGELYAPERMPGADLHWRWVDGGLPLLRATWSAGPLTVTSELFTDGDADARDVRTHLSVDVQNASTDPVAGTLHVVFRSFGPTGGPVHELEFDRRDVLVNGAVTFTFDADPDSVQAVDSSAGGEDIGVLLEAGRRSGTAWVTDSTTWASGGADFSFDLVPGARYTRRGTAFVHAGHPHLTWLHRPRGAQLADDDRQGFVERWRDRIGLELDLPDARFSEAIRAQLAYLTMSTVGLEPRISPISYPLWWLRDGAYVLTALGKGGWGRWVDQAIRDVARRDPFGGFGAEGDGAGQLIWLISEHYLMTRDLDFLRAHFRDVQRNAALIMRMRGASTPLFGATSIRTPQMMLEPSADLMCRPGADGLIAGRMDGHFPRFWVNGWALFGLRRAALCADALGEDSEPYRHEAEQLWSEIRRLVPEHFGENDRDLTGSVWPTGWAEVDDPDIRLGFEEFWQKTRCPDGVHVPEPEWTYFEAGQAHNYMLLGEREKAWVSIEMFLTRHAAPGLFTFHEGIGDENSSLQWQRSRGWDDIPHVTPHGWTAAELFLLLRDCLVREHGDDLVIGSGVPATWVDHDFSVGRLPTHFGRAEVVYTAADRTLRVHTERPCARVVSELPWAVQLDATSADALRPTGASPSSNRSASADAPDPRGARA